MKIDRLSIEENIMYISLDQLKKWHTQCTHSLYTVYTIHLYTCTLFIMHKLYNINTVQKSRDYIKGEIYKIGSFYKDLFTLPKK